MINVNSTSFFKKFFSFIVLIIFLCGVVFSDGVFSARRKKSGSKSRRSANSSKSRKKKSGSSRRSAGSARGRSKSKGKSRRSAGSSKRRSASSARSTTRRAGNITDKLVRANTSHPTLNNDTPKIENEEVVEVEDGDKILCPIGKLLKKGEDGDYHFSVKGTCVAPEDTKEGYLKGDEASINNKLVELGSPTMPSWINKDDAVYLECTDDYVLSSDYNNNHILKKQLKKDFKNNPPCVSIHNFCPINDVVMKKQGKYFSDDSEEAKACYKVRNSTLDPLSKQAIEKLYSETGKEFKYGRSFKMQCESGFIPEKYKDSDAVVSCKACPQFYKPDDKGLKCVPGIPCDSGKYFDDTKGVCEACSPGTYNPDKNKVGVSACQSAPAGYYVSSPAAYDKIKCPKGKYCPGEKTISPKICPAGTYNDTEEATSESACIKCPEDSKKSSPGSTSIKDCIPNITISDCKAGTYFDGEDCKQCPTGQASHPKSSSCHTCKKGEYILNGECKSCELGYYCPDGVNKQSCPENTYTAWTGREQCDKCLAHVWMGIGNEYVTKGFGNWYSAFVKVDPIDGTYYCDKEEFTKGKIVIYENGKKDEVKSNGYSSDKNKKVSDVVDNIISLGGAYCANGIQGYHGEPMGDYKPKIPLIGNETAGHHIAYGYGFTLQCDPKGGAITLKPTGMTRAQAKRLSRFLIPDFARRRVYLDRREWEGFSNQAKISTEALTDRRPARASRVSVMY